MLLAVVIKPHLLSFVTFNAKLLLQLDINMTYVVVLDIYHVLSVIRGDKEKHRVFTLKKLEPANDQKGTNFLSVD